MARHCWGLRKSSPSHNFTVAAAATAIFREHPEDSDIETIDFILATVDGMEIAFLR
jgi:hypothetical protein